MKTARELSDATDAALAAATAARNALVESSDRALVPTLTALDRVGMALDEAGSRAGLWRHVHPDEALRTAAEESEQKISAFATALSLDRAVFDAVSAAAKDSALAKADRGTRHLVQRTLRDFRRSGVDRDEATRAKVTALQEELVKIGQEFSANIAKDTREIRVEAKTLDGLPADWIRAHAPGADGKIAVTTNYPDYYPFMTFCRDAAARKALYLAFRQRATPVNVPVLVQLLAKRHELAVLLGFPSWAAFITEDKMIGSDRAAAEFIEKITAASETRMKADVATLLAEKRKDEPAATEVFDYDRAYYEERVRSTQYAFDSQSVRPYFEFGRVRTGLFDVTSKMFGLVYEADPAAQRWHPEVEVFRVKDAASGKPVGSFHLDMHPRDGKFKHAAMFQIRTGVEGSVLPEAALVCNFPRASGSDPALMEFSDVRTFFHEFGHLLHHLMGGHVKWAGNSGIRTEWDFVEAPSQMLEEWVLDYDTLATFAKHHATGETIPRALVEKMVRAQEFGKGMQVRHQMFYAALSLELYRRDPNGIDTGAIARELQNRYSPFRYVDGSCWEASFGHLDDYSAIYYTYMWSLVIAKDLFSAFQKSGLLERGVCARYRENVLGPGGSAPAAELVRDFLGRETSFDAFARWLDAA